MRHHRSTTHPVRSYGCGLLLTLACTVLSAYGDFYVSPRGDDAFPGSRERPFKTISRARDAARTVDGSVTVFLRGGTYPIHETIVFGVQDGKVRYEAFEGERPVISSAVSVTGWEKGEGRLWTADMPEGVEDFKVMFDGGRMLDRARGMGFQSPKQTFAAFATRNVARSEDRPLLRRLEFPEGAIRNWENIEDVEAFFCGVPWTFNFSPLESVDLENKVATLKYEGNTPPFTTPKPYNPAYVENTIDVLDQPGEWCVDTRTRKITYWPVNGSPGDEVRVPTLTEFFRVEGEIDYDGPTDRPVQGLAFVGLTFTQGDRYSWWPDHKGWGIQHDWDKFDHGNALLRFRGAEDCLVDRCRFVNSGNSAIRLDLYAQNITVRNNLINRVGHMGILLCGYGPGTKDVNKNNRVVNNLIRRVGERVWHGHAIFVWQSGSNVIANNHIREVPRKAIGICGVRGAILMEGRKVDWDEASKTIRWDELGQDIFEEDGQLQERILPYLHARNNVVENNYIYRARTKIGDGAALNVSGAGTGNVMRRNMLYMCLGNGMRCDDWQQGTTFAENLILSGGAVHKGKNDYINNIFVNSTIRFTLYPGQQPNPGSKIHHNVFYFTRKGLQPYTSRSSGTIDTPESCDLKSNLYFCEAGNEALREFVSAKQAAGMDKGSLVSDPQFAVPLSLTVEARPEHYQLKQDSPAIALGFRQIDTASIGLTDAFPEVFLREVFPAKRGLDVSGKARVVAASTGRRDASVILTPSRTLTTRYESKKGVAPFVTVELDDETPIDGAEIIADVKDRQNSMRTLTVWTSVNRKDWTEIWRADPYHIAMGRDWQVNPYQVLPARYVKVGLRPVTELPFPAGDDRKLPGGISLRLNRIRVFSPLGSSSPLGASSMLPLRAGEKWPWRGRESTPLDWVP